MVTFLVSSNRGVVSVYTCGYVALYTINYSLFYSGYVCSMPSCIHRIRQVWGGRDLGAPPESWAGTPPSFPGCSKPCPGLGTPGIQGQPQLSQCVQPCSSLVFPFTSPGLWLLHCDHYSPGGDLDPALGAAAISGPMLVCVFWSYVEQDSCLLYLHTSQ